jgi:hypothetical protein
VQSSLCERTTLSALTIAANLIKQYLPMPVKDFHFPGQRGWLMSVRPTETRNFAGFSPDLPLLSVMASVSLRGARVRHRTARVGLVETALASRKVLHQLSSKRPGFHSSFSQFFSHVFV